MPSPVYNQMQPQNNLLSMLNRLKQNPYEVISQKFNIPQNMNDPNQIIQHLLNTNQVSQDQVNQIMRLKNDPQMQNLFR